MYGSAERKVTNEHNQFYPTQLDPQPPIRTYVVAWAAVVGMLVRVIEWANEEE